MPFEALSQSPRLRRFAIKICRAFWRTQRASLAHAVIVAQREDNRFLALNLASGELGLPSLELDGWQPVVTQVKIWLDELLHQPSTLQLKAVDGTPGPQGVTFLYSAQINSPQAHTPCVWLDPEVESSALPLRDRRLLLMGIA
jgi:hypothetical protein